MASMLSIVNDCKKQHFILIQFICTHRHNYLACFSFIISDASVLLVVGAAIPEIRSHSLTKETQSAQDSTLPQHQYPDVHKDNIQSSIVRQERSIPSGGNCNSWTAWYNNNTPTTADKNDYESMSPSSLKTVCPSALGGNITKMECVDDKGEPFAGIREDRLHRFTINCDDPKVGAVCTVKDNTWEKQCPDLSVRYFCACPKSAGLSTKVSLTTTQTPPTTRQVLSTSDVSSLASSQVLSSATRNLSTSGKATSTRSQSTTRPTLSSMTYLDTGTKSTTEQSLGNILRYEGDGFTETDSKIIFYSSIVMGSGFLLLTLLTCIIMCIVCKRKVEPEEEDERNKVTQVSPLGSV
ncbi:hypothetical protein ACF0H5_003186 [Mactra antiquata]